jgi:hypothetical protein
MAIKAFRSGETARHWSDDPFNEELIPEIDGISFRFKMPSKGGGVTDVKLSVTSENFDATAKAMIAGSRDAAIRAFCAALLASRSRRESCWNLMARLRAS